MMIVRWLALELLIATVAVAGVSIVFNQRGGAAELSTAAPYTKFGKTRDLDKVLKLGAGGCLRGPVRLYDVKGKTVLALSPGVHYPMACGDQQGPEPATGATECWPVWQCNGTPETNHPNCKCWENK